MEQCEICAAKDAQIFQMTAHIARLTQMMAQDHHIIMALKQERIMTDEQMKELRELLLKAQRKQGETK